MTTKRTRTDTRDITLLFAVLIIAIVAVNFEERIAALVAAHLGAVMVVIVAGGLALMGWALVHGGHGADAADARMLPQTWTRTPSVDIRCDLCGDRKVSFVCGDHNLTLCAACTQRHDRFAACNIRYVPAAHEIQGRRA